MIILITGATAGFGRALARLLVSKGHQVIAAGRRAERLAALQQELGASLRPLLLDMDDIAAMDKLLARLPAELQAIDVLVNNAGLALGLEPAPRADLADD